MTILFYTSAVIAVISALLVITGTNVMRAVLSLLCMVLAIATIMYCMGSAYIALLLIVVYAGAVLVLFVFVVMILNQGAKAQVRESDWLSGKFWIFPVSVAGILLLELVWAVADGQIYRRTIAAKQVGISLFTDYIVGVELASLLLLAALVAAFHLGNRLTSSECENE